MAFALAILAFFNYHGNVSENSILTLIAICTTLIVGINVVDAVKVNEMRKKIDELNTVTSNLEKNDKQMNVAVYVAWGLAFISWLPYTSFIQLQKGLIIAIQIEDPHKVGLCLDCMEKVLEMIYLMKKKGQRVCKTGREKIPKTVPEDIAVEKMYKPFKDRIMNVYKTINTIIEEEKNN